MKPASSPQIVGPEVVKGTRSTLHVVGSGWQNVIVQEVRATTCIVASETDRYRAPWSDKLSKVRNGISKWSAGRKAGQRAPRSQPRSAPKRSSAKRKTRTLPYEKREHAGGGEGGTEGGTRKRTREERVVGVGQRSICLVLEHTLTATDLPHPSTVRVHRVSSIIILIATPCDGIHTRAKLINRGKILRGRTPGRE